VVYPSIDLERLRKLMKNQSEWFMYRQRFELHILRIKAGNNRYGNAIMFLLQKGGLT
jgi:hypothetical protein